MTEKELADTKAKYWSFAGSGIHRGVQPSHAEGDKLLPPDPVRVPVEATA